ISTLLAVPVIVDGAPRGVLYGGTWHSSTIGDSVAAPAFQVADALAAEFAVRDEVRRRVALRATTPPADPPTATLPPAHREELRASYAELRSIAAGVQDGPLRERLSALERRLAAISGDENSIEPLDVRLSPRETDVLACAALGSTNAEIASALAIREGTVKAYLGSAMAKLDASTRHAAVARARRAGLLP
ncbi:MAG TPA: helix-turn-helix transcriptional regulator, partial [Microbacterium sp.]|uniref:helix-turn-helix transcriptional regulator n=1 Tax=Microbacterium sp. TaxID=51671 RepID=UPI002C5304FC